MLNFDIVLLSSVEDEIRLGEGDDNDNGGQGPRRVKHVPHIGDGWQKVIDREELIVWQKPVPGSYVYEYKGTVIDSWSRSERFWLQRTPTGVSLRILTHSSSGRVTSQIHSSTLKSTRPQNQTT